MTGCGCLTLVAGIVGLLVLFVRGSTDAGEPFEQALALLFVAVVAREAVRTSRTRRRIRREATALASVASVAGVPVRG